MSIKPEGVTKADWAVYQKVLSIVNTTPGHMKGYTFGTSDFVKADIQPRAVPAT